MIRQRTFHLSEANPFQPFVSGDAAQNIQRTLRWLAGLSLLAAVLLVGCGEGGPRLADTPVPPVTVSKPVIRSVINFDEYEGRIAPQLSVEVRARVRGHLTKVAFEDGQMVKEKMLLFEIDR